MKNIGYIVATPAEFLIHQRLGKIRRQGRGISALSLPIIDRCYRIPSCTHSLTFIADQITAENQGVEVSGFAIWKIDDPETAIRNFNFADQDSAIIAIRASLKDVVESAIRHQVANMTIEDVLRKRGTIILELKKELAYIAGQWGLTVETIEIKNVRISSAQVFANMQAGFRDEVRLASETSGLETDREIAERRFAQRELLALREQEFKRRESEREAEIDAISARAAAELDALKDREESKLKAQRLALGAELAESEHASREKMLRLDEKLDAVERQAQGERHTLETERQCHTAALAKVRDAMERGRIETANLASPTLAFVEKLPDALGMLALKQLSLGDDALRQLADGMLALAGKESK